MTLPNLPTLNPAAVAATPSPAGAAKAAGTPGADPAGRAEDFARALDRAAAKREDAAAHQARERDRPSGAAASRHEPTDPSRRSDGAWNGRRAAAQDKKGVDADSGEADRATPAEASGDDTADEAIDVAALIGGQAEGARREAAKPDAAQLPTAAAFGQAVAAAAHERHAAACDGADPPAASTQAPARPVWGRQASASEATTATVLPGRAVAESLHDPRAAAPTRPDPDAGDLADRGATAAERAQDRPAHDRAADAFADADARDAASVAGATQAARGLAAASPAEVGPGREPFGHGVAQAARERHAAGEPAPVAGAGPNPKVDDASLPPTASEAHAATQGAGGWIAASWSARANGNVDPAGGAAPGADSGAIAASPADPAPPAASVAPLPPLATQVARSDAAGALRHADLHEPVGSPRFAPALGARVVTLVRDGVEQAQVRLNPAELGPIAVHIRIDGTRAEVDFSAAHALTRQALQDAVPALAGALRESGLTLAGGGVFEQPRESRDPAGDAAPGRSSAADRGRAGGAEPEVAAPARSRERGMVDLFA